MSDVEVRPLWGWKMILPQRQDAKCRACAKSWEECCLWVPEPLLLPAAAEMNPCGPGVAPCGFPSSVAQIYLPVSAYTPPLRKALTLVAAGI
eukprot:568868-Amorphochlora_amoeboformis.AAC.1